MKIHIWKNYQLWGIVMMFSAGFIGYALYLKAPISRPLYHACGALDWLIPSLLGIFGLIFAFDANESLLVAPLALAAMLLSLLSAMLVRAGYVGAGFRHTIDSLDRVLFPKAGLYAIWIMIGCIASACWTVSIRDLGQRIWRALWDLRIPIKSVTPELVSSHVVHSAEIVDVTPRATHVYSAYALPEATFLLPAKAHQHQGVDQSQQLVGIFDRFGLQVRAAGTPEHGPSVTRYGIRPAAGTKAQEVMKLAVDVAVALGVEHVTIAPVPGKASVFGVDVPQRKRGEVPIRSVLESMKPSDALNVCLGQDISGKPVVYDIRDMPHCLVAGATKTGKSVCLNAIISSILMTHTPDTVRMLFIDPKRVELSVYNGVPHLLEPVITDPQNAAAALEKVVAEMDQLYERMETLGVQTIEEYNKKSNERQPYQLIVIDELNDLMLRARASIEYSMTRLAQLGRATGVHIIVATQRPSAEVLSGVIRSNLPSRIAFSVAKGKDSEIILDEWGAEKLLGKGDMIFKPQGAGAIRIQGANITRPEVERIVAHWKAQSRRECLPSVDEPQLVLETIEQATDFDPWAYDAAKYIIEQKRASIVGIKEGLRVGQPRAKKIMSQLHSLSIVGDKRGRGVDRDILITDISDIKELFGREHIHE